MKAEAQAGVLARILDGVARDVAARAGERRDWERRAARAETPPRFAAAFAGGTVGLIAEVKRRSPSEGGFAGAVDPVNVARAYADGGAAAISVLTEGPHFGGSLADLEGVARATGLPVLRKDFILDPLQLYEARAAGAAAALLIVRALTAERLAALAALARELGLATLVEVHAADELPVALAARPDAVGVNVRDLDSLVLHPDVADALLPRIPRAVIAVAESGIADREGVSRVAALGADAVLVGTSLLRAGAPAAAARALTGVARVEGVRP